MIREHAKLGGFPANSVSQVFTTIDPTTADMYSRQPPKQTIRHLKLFVFRLNKNHKKTSSQKIRRFKFVFKIIPNLAYWHLKTLIDLVALVLL
jgi:hypothetical protein